MEGSKVYIVRWGFKDQDDVDQKLFIMEKDAHAFMQDRKNDFVERSHKLKAANRLLRTIQLNEFEETENNHYEVEDYCWVDLVESILH